MIDLVCRKSLEYVHQWNKGSDNPVSTPETRNRQLLRGSKDKEIKLSVDMG